MLFWKEFIFEIVMALSKMSESFPFLSSQGLKFQLNCSLCDFRIPGSKISPHSLMIFCPAWNVTFSQRFCGYVGLSGDETGDKENLSAKDKECLSEFFTWLKACFGGKRLPKCQRARHVGSIHGFRGGGTRPTVTRSFLLALFIHDLKYALQYLHVRQVPQCQVPKRGRRVWRGLQE